MLTVDYMNVRDAMLGEDDERYFIDSFLDQEVSLARIFQQALRDKNFNFLTTLLDDILQFELDGYVEDMVKEAINFLVDDGAISRAIGRELKNGDLLRFEEEFYPHTKAQSFAADLARDGDSDTYSEAYSNFAAYRMAKRGSHSKTELAQWAEIMNIMTEQGLLDTKPKKRRKR